MSTSSLVFNGGGYINVGDVPELSFERTDSFSISFWYRASDLSTVRHILAKMEGTGNFQGYSVQILDVSGRIRFLLGNSVANRLRIDTLSTAFVDGRWHHAVITYDGTSSASGVAIYVDGVAQTLTAVDDTLSATTITTKPFQIGVRDDTDGPYIGTIDEVAIYDKDLTSGEVTTIYGAGLPPDLTSVGPTGNLVGYWRLGEGQTTLTSVSAVSTLFDGVNEYAVVGDVAPLQFDRTDPFSLACWFKFTSGATQLLLSKLDASSPNTGYEIFTISGGLIGFQLIGNPSGNQMRIDTTVAYNDNRWHHVVATWDGDVAGGAAGAHIYIDGVDHAVSIFSDDLTTSILTTTPFQMGARDGANVPFNGYLDEVAVYDKELSASEVTTIYANRPVDLTSVGPTGNLVGYWQMGDGATFPTIPDASANSNDATMTNMESGDFVAEVPPDKVQVPDLSASANTGLYGDDGTIVVTNDIPSPSVVAESSLSTDFGGTDEYVAIGDAPELQFEFSDPFSLSAWVKVTGTPGTNYVIISKQAGSTTFRGWSLRMDTAGRFEFAMISDAATNDDAAQRTNSAFNNGQWHHIVVVPDGTGNASGVAMYVDGLAQATTTSIAGPVAGTILTTEGAAIGARTPSSPAEFIIGRIDEVAVYNKRLTSLEVLSIYNGGAAPDLSDRGPAYALVAWWRMGEGDTHPILKDRQTIRSITASDAISDRSVSGNDGTMVNMEDADITNDTPGDASGYSVTLDGVNEYVDMGNVAALSFERTDSFSISVWFKTSSGSNQLILAKMQDASPYRGYLLGIDPTGQMSVLIRNTLSTNYLHVRSTTSGFNDGAWHHCVMTYDGSSSASGVTVYVDANNEALTIVADTLSATILNTIAFQVGARDAFTGPGSNDWFNGQVDELSIYDAELSLSEVQTIYNSGQPLDVTLLSTYSNLVGYWGMGEAANDGTMTNMEAGDIVLDSPGEPTIVLAMPASALDPTPDGEPDPIDGVLAFSSGTGGSTTTDFFKMRALASPGPGYVTWIVQNNPDFAGTFAPASIQGGTAVVADQWVADVV